MLGVRQDTTKKGTTVTNNYQKNVLVTSTMRGLAVPDGVTIAMGEIAEDMREGLLALTVGEAAGDGLVDGGRRGRAGREADTTLSGLGCATGVSAGRSPSVGVESGSMAADACDRRRR